MRDSEDHRQPLDRSGSQHHVPPPRHRLIRDALEAEEIAVEWLRWVGFHDAHRVGDAAPEGISGSAVRAVTLFDPLPASRSDVESLYRWAAGHNAVAVSFSFAGWTPDTYTLAAEFGIPLVRFTFAGNIEPNNEAARRLIPQPLRSDTDRKRP